MKSFFGKNAKLAIAALSLMPATAFVQTPTNIPMAIPTNPCAIYSEKTIDSLEYTTKQAKNIVQSNHIFIAKGDQLCQKLTTLGQSEEVKNLIPKEKQNEIKQIVEDHAQTVKKQIDVLLNEGIKPELQIMAQRIGDLLKEDKEKFKDLSQRAESTVKEFLKDPEVKSAIKSIEVEGKKLEKHLKNIFK